MFRFRSARLGEGGKVIFVICAIKEYTSAQYEVRIGQFRGRGLVRNKDGSLLEELRRIQSQKPVFRHNSPLIMSQLNYRTPHTRSRRASAAYKGWNISEIFKNQLLSRSGGSGTKMALTRSGSRV